MASGPSLTEQDVQAVQVWREASSKHRVIVVNTTWRLAPWADTLYAMDSAWWRFYYAEVKQGYNGEMLTKSAGGLPGVAKVRIHPGGNSGAGAITLALKRRAKRVILLGYDCRYADDGRRHWHGDHPEELKNCESIEKFRDHCANVRRHFIRADIVNASRSTALKIWPRVSLEGALHG
jgi:hypothetical protein